MYDGTLVWHDFDNTICNGLMSPKETVRTANGQEMLDKYDFLFNEMAIFEKKVYTQTGGVDQRGFHNYPGNQQAEHMNAYSDRIVRKAQANHFLTPDVSWYYNQPKMIKEAEVRLPHCRRLPSGLLYPGVLHEVPPLFEAVRKGLDTKST